MNSAKLKQLVEDVQDPDSLVTMLREGLGWQLHPEFVLDDSPEISQGVKGSPCRAYEFVGDFQDRKVFLVEFEAPYVRRDLRGILASLRRHNALTKRFGTLEGVGDTVFIVASPGYEDVRFVLFEAKSGGQPKIRSFGWKQGEAGRTLLDINLPALAHTRIAKWEAAWNVEALTEQFFADYTKVFARVEASIVGLTDAKERRAFTQSLFNRLMFLCFLQRKGWLEYPSGDRTNRQSYLFNLWDQNQDQFYNRLRLLFFSGLNSPGGGGERSLLEHEIGRVPFLNGGLFDPHPVFDSSQVTVPDSAFADILGESGLFQRYAFTVTESTPLDIEVALDPEMLGKIFEELVTGRHESGSYYTPRPIVSFMCREGLKGYLGGHEALVDNLDATGIDVAEARDLIQKLESVKVCDPACGSGAYLVGMLQEIHGLQRLLDTTAHQLSARDDYARKLRIIRDCIYGVDIDPFAVQIAWLRLWLALVVDCDLHPLDNAEDADKVALPNLDAKIECKDSLSGPAPQDQFGKVEGFHRELIYRYSSEKAEYMSAHTTTAKSEWLSRMNGSRSEIVGWLRGDRSDAERRLVEARYRATQAQDERERTLSMRAIELIEVEIKSCKPSPATGSMDWAVDFAEVFVDVQGHLATVQGFDIVLANPPYVRQEAIKQTMGDAYKRASWVPFQQDQERPIYTCTSTKGVSSFSSRVECLFTSRRTSGSGRRTA